MTEKPSEVRFRLIRADDLPATNPENDAFVFGLQDTNNRASATAPGSARYISLQSSGTAQVL